jgi:hypothetical protein
MSATSRAADRVTFDEHEHSFTIRLDGVRVGSIGFAQVSVGDSWARRYSVEIPGVERIEVGRLVEAKRMARRALRGKVPGIEPKRSRRRRAEPRKETRDAATIIFDELAAFLKKKGIKVPKSTWRITLCAETTEEPDHPAVARAHIIANDWEELDLDLAADHRRNGRCPEHCRQP